MKIRVRQFENEHPAPHGWIQWKGTDVCIDIHCICGVMLHFDGDFMYYVKCGSCGRFYECDGHITLHEIPAEEITAAANEICDPIVLVPQDSDAQ